MTTQTIEGLLTNSVHSTKWWFCLSPVDERATQEANRSADREIDLYHVRLEVLKYDEHMYPCMYRHCVLVFSSYSTITRE